MTDHYTGRTFDRVVPWYARQNTHELRAAEYRNLRHVLGARVGPVAQYNNDPRLLSPVSMWPQWTFHAESRRCLPCTWLTGARCDGYPNLLECQARNGEIPEVDVPAPRPYTYTCARGGACVPCGEFDGTELACDEFPTQRACTSAHGETIFARVP